MKRRIAIVFSIVLMSFIGMSNAHAASDYWACVAVYDVGACLKNPLPPPPEF